MSTWNDLQGMRFTGDLLPDGSIRWGKSAVFLVTSSILNKCICCQMRNISDPKSFIRFSISQTASIVTSIQ